MTEARWDRGLKPTVFGSRSPVSRFMLVDRAGAAIGLTLLVAANAIWVRKPQLWLLVAPLVLLMLALTLALRLLDRPGDRSLLAALGLATVGNWLVSVVVPTLLPFLWPVMVLTVIMPLVLATPYLNRRLLLVVLLIGTVFVGAVGAIGLLNDDGGALPDLDDEFELVLVLGGMMAVIVPIALIVWQNNELQRTNLQRANDLNARLQDSQAKLAASRRRVVEAADTERRRIERDLHDGAQQRLVALGVQLRLLESQSSDEALKSLTTGLVAEVDGAVEELRELAHGIYPPLLRSQGLGPALTAVARRSPLPVETRVDDVGRLDPSIETAMYFVALEAMTNAAKHAPDADLVLTLGRDGESVVLSVADDGPGFALEETTGSHGLDHMADRVAAIGGELKLASTPGRGTKVTASISPQQAGTNTGSVSATDRP